MATTSHHLPWEIITDILCRLPLKDVLRYRSVSTSWCSLIDGRDFVKLHFKHSPESTSQLGFIFGGTNDLCWAAFSDLSSFIRLTYPIGDDKGITVAGSSNGLLALMNSKGDAAIWNPFTRSRRYISLPISDHFGSFPFHSFEILLTGFGYDPITEDYKFLLMIEFNGIMDLSFTREVKVYSLKARKWKGIDHFPSNYTYLRNNGVLFGNALHYWMVKVNPDNWDTILVFDLVTEKCQEMGLPDYNGRETCSCLKLVDLGGSFCAVMVPNYDPVLEISERVDVWEMKQYGVKESWTKLFSVATSIATGPFNYLVPIAFLQNGDQVLLEQDGKKLLLFDMKMKRVMKRVGSSFPYICDTIVCVKSLVGLDSVHTTSWNSKQGKNINVLGKKKQSGKKRDDFLSKGFKLVL
ncbi:unnamed protein product [Cuscuta europaea]|uniref:F-box domain-containing protein n=1 Tax=Cuscuta europaea TaxID=41803 RepID=A0A9P0ZJM7_CUSEU|nr:unnamed protein product [Cuscuta europaea]